MNNFNFDLCQQLTAGMVEELCRRKAAADRLLNEIQRVAADAETFLQGQPENNRQLIDCGPGCGSCCIVNVAILFPEGLAIVRYLGGLKKASRQQIGDKLEELWRAVRGLDDEERMFLRRSCAFLDEQGSCQIYPVRPLLCRSISSTDADSCRQALVDQVFGMESAVLMHLFQQQLYETLFAGIGRGLEKAGLDGRSWPLSGLVRYLLKNSVAEGDLLAGRQLGWQEIYS